MKRMLALFLCLVLVTGLLSGCVTPDAGKDTTTPPPPTQYVPRETPEVKYHAPAQNFAGGSGTEADPYQISTASELALLNDQAGEEAYYILTADIRLNDTTGFGGWADSAPEYGWMPIGSHTAFSGVFDGNGHTISGMYINADTSRDDADSYGLFARVRGTVKNLILERSFICVSGPGKNVGAIAGIAAVDDATIESCVSHVTITAYGAGNLGGIVGSGEGTIAYCQFGGSLTQLDDTWSHMGGISGSGCRIIGCTNFGSVTGRGYSGGIVGYGSSVTDSVNQGIVSGDTAGGITGSLYRAGLGVEPTLTELGLWNCVNEGQIYADSCAGGIAGKVGNDEEDVDMYISGCVNHGPVYCNQSAAGIICSLCVERANILKVENCVNYADILGQDKVGGIICELTGGVLNQKGNVTISGCENQGNITSAEGMYSGGIVTYFLLMGAKIDLNLTIEKCINSGSIVSQKHAGGILCFSSSMLGADNISDTSSITLSGCTNTGDILGQSSNSFVGGIAGNIGVEGIRTRFENCSNSGTVSLELSLTEAEIQETLDSPVLMSLSQMVGGIVGRLGEGVMLTTDNDEGKAANVNRDNAWIIFLDCRNSGVLAVTDYSGYTTSDGRIIWKNYLGGIIGYTCAEDAYSFFVENCAFTGADRGLGNPEYPDI